MPRDKEILQFNPTHSAIKLDGDTNVATISDLHIGVAHREKIGGKLYISDDEIVNGVDEIIKKIGSKNPAKKSHLVLNGDIFEMVYCKEPSDAEITGVGTERHHELRANQRQKYIDILDKWVQVAKENNCTIHYVCGNHDDDKKFVKQVLEFEKGKENFHFHPVALRLGSAFFTHGDLPLRAGDDGIVPNKRELNLERHYVVEKHDDDNVVTNPFSVCGRTARLFRNIENSVNAHVHELVSKRLDEMNPNEKRSAKILAALVINTQFLDGFPEQGVPAATRVCTGHTHDGCLGVKVPRDSLIYKGMAEKQDVIFDNTGAGINVERLHAIRYSMNNNQVKTAETIDLDLHADREKADIAKEQIWATLVKKYGDKPFGHGNSR